MTIINKDNNISLRTKAQQRGFTLVETGMAMTVLCLLLSAATGIYQIYAKAHYNAVNAARLQKVTVALDNYLANNGYLPCPADPSPLEATPNYGRGACPTYPSSNFPVAATSVPAAIQYIPSEDRASVTTQPNLLFPHGITFANNVLIGAVPARDLGLPDADMVTPNGYLFVYAVTESMTWPESAPTGNPWGGPDASLGGIDIIYPGGNPSLATDSLLATTPYGKGSAPYVVASPPKNGAGAWYNGHPPPACVMPPGTTISDCGTRFYGGSGIYKGN